MHRDRPRPNFVDVHRPTDGASSMITSMNLISYRFLGLYSNFMLNIV